MHEGAQTINDGIDFGLPPLPIPRDQDEVNDRVIGLLEAHEPVPLRETEIARCANADLLQVRETLELALASGFAKRAGKDFWKSTTGATIEQWRRRREYHDYLSSELWKRTRTLALDYYGHSCCLCNSHGKLNVHHRTYERVGNERLTDLIVLCRDCHANYHRKAA